MNQCLIDAFYTVLFSSGFIIFIGLVKGILCFAYDYIPWFHDFADKFVDKFTN